MPSNRTRYLLITVVVAVTVLLIIGAIFYLTRRSHRHLRRVTPPDSCPRPKQYATNYDFDYTNKPGEYKTNSTVDYFRLSLSWSPTFCQGKSHAKDLFQCQHEFGFIVHGLWPNKAKDNHTTSFSIQSHPRNCRNEGEIPIETIKKYFCIMPSETLMQAEWEKHGTCYWTKPEDYFEQINKLYSQIHLPDDIKEIHNNQTIPRRLRRTFIKQSFLHSNPQLTAEQIAITMVKKERKLKEVAFCYDHQFNHIKCV